MRIYFSGIGGVAIGPLAMIASDLGYEVFGSDLQASPTTDALATRGIEISFDQSGEFLRQKSTEKVDLFVYTAALPSDHPELLLAQNLGIKAVKRHELINQILSDNNLKLVAVSGTHGKTTVTAMLAWVFQSLGKNFSHSVGTNLSFAPIGRFQSGSEYFIYEADEFDRNFLQFKPAVAVVTSIDFDHADTYPTKADYNQAFSQFVAGAEKSFVWDMDATQLTNIPTSANILSTSQADLGFTLAGEHNRKNAALAAEVLLSLGFEAEQVREVLNAYPGSQRRFEKIADRLYSDYAHHPSEIKATIQLARELSNQITVVYQPHQNIRQHEIMRAGGYGGCFSGAKQVYWLPTYLSRENNSLSELQPAVLAASVQGTPTAVVELDDILRQKITDCLAAGDLVIAMSAGNLDDWLRQNFKN